MARWSVTVKKMALQWARCMGLPDGAVVEIRLRKNRAEVVVESDKQLQKDLPPDSISSSQSDAGTSSRRPV